MVATSLGDLILDSGTGQLVLFGEAGTSGGQSYMRTLTSGPTDLRRFGREWAVLEELVAHRGVSVRDRMVDGPSRVIDVHYRDLMADQVGTVASVLAFAGVPFTHGSRAAVEAVKRGVPQALS